MISWCLSGPTYLFKVERSHNCLFGLLFEQPEELRTLSGYAYSDIVGCMFMIRDCQRSLDPEFEVVVRRYAQPQRLHVSLRQIPIMIPA